jgi:F-type H+-transporting ATPase subunit c
MTKKFFMLLTLLLLASTVALAQTPQTNTSGSQWVPISAGLGMALASGLCGLAQAKAVASAAEGMARNPGAAAAIRFALLLGLVLIESLALYTLVVIMVGTGFGPWVK